MNGEQTRREPVEPVVVVTRDEGADGPLTRALEARGARVMRLPTVAFAPPPDPGAVDHVLSDPDRYDWVVFTSPRAVEAVCSRPAWTDDRARSRCRVAAAGPATADRLASYGVSAEIVAEHPGASTLAAALRETLGDGRSRILWPRSDIADLDLVDALNAAGAEVTAPVVYRTVTAAPDTAEFLRLLHADGIAGVTFLSPSSASGLAAALGAPDLSVLAGRTVVGSIGPTTSAALAAHGAPADVESTQRTSADLAAAVMAAIGSRAEPWDTTTDPASPRKERPR